MANTGYVWFELDVTAHVRAELAQGAVRFALANPAVSSQLVAVQARESSNPAQLVLAMNTAPSVTLTSPANGATYTAPATVLLAASATDTDGTIAKVEFFHGGTNLIATVTAAPYTFDWTNVAAGSYSLTAKATDDLNGTATSAPVGITVSAAVGQLYFIHTDHLNTPRLVADAMGTTVWRWDQQEPFGNNPADENPSGLGVFEFPLRFPGQYADKETGLHYNYFRDYDSGLGRYVQSDPIGLAGGINTYAYSGSSPLWFFDPLGLRVLNPEKFPISPDVVAALWEFNRLIGCDKDIVITGGNRPSDATIGAGAGSPHVQGIAADIAVPGQSHLETANQAAASGLFGGVGWYQEGYRGPRGEGPHVHVDRRKNGPARWGHPAEGRTMHGYFPKYEIELNPNNCDCQDLDK